MAKINIVWNLPHAILRVACLTGFLMFAAFSALWESLAALLAEEPYRFGPDMAGAFGFVGIAGLLASPWIGRAVDRLSDRLVLCAGALTVLLAFLLVIEADAHIGFLIAAMTLLDIGNRAGLVANQSRIYALSAEARSRLNTVFMTSYFLGGATGAAVAAHLTQRFGWHGLAANGIVLALCALVTAVATKRIQP